MLQAKPIDQQFYPIVRSSLERLCVFTPFIGLLNVLFHKFFGSWIVGTNRHAEMQSLDLGMRFFINRRDRIFKIVQLAGFVIANTAITGR